MSAISGVFYRDGRPVDADRIHRMVQTLAHRGPDGQQSWYKKAVGLGYCALQTTHESLHDTQPLQRVEDDLCLVADARIDNREELVKTLEIKKAGKSEITDAELILEAYKRWGDTAPSQLIGDFAFAIWNGRQQELFCARDAMGVKPFYYYLSDHLFAFGSEIKALLSLREVPRKLNERAILYYLVECLNDKELTFYQAIFRLPPAHAMTVSRKSVRLWQYWQLDRERELCCKHDDDYVDGFRDVFFEAIRCRMRSAAPLGVLLSGGLDSSSVACVARLLQDNSGQGPIKTFSGIFPGLPQEQRRQIDERAYLERVTAQGGFDTYLLRADLLSPLAGLEEILRLHDEPVLMRGHYFYQALLKTAHDQGVRAMLDGCEGDVAVSYGYLKFTELATAGRWKAFADLAHLVSQNCMTQNRNYPPSLAFWRYGFEALASSGSARTWKRFAGQLKDVSTYLGISRWHLMKQLAREQIRRRRAHASYPWSSLSFVNSQFIKRIGLPEDISVEVCTQREGHIQALESGQLSHTLEVTDKLSVAHGIEPRHPFFDRRLLEYCVALPSEQIFYGGWQRAILRRALEGVLPHQVQRRLGKSDHGVNVTYNFFKYEKTRIDALLSRDFDIIYPYVELRGLREAYRRYTIQPTITRLMPLRRIVVLTAWLRQAW